MLSNIQLKANIPHGTRPVPHWIAESATYAQRVQSMLNEARIYCMPPEQRWRVDKHVLRLASRTATRVLMNGPSPGLQVRRQAVLQSARAMITGPARLLNLASSSFPQICKFACVTEGFATILDRPGFDKLASNIMTRDLQTQPADLNPDEPSADHNAVMPDARTVVNIAHADLPPT